MSFFSSTAPITTNNSSASVDSSDRLYLGKGASDSFLLLKYANRHGLIAGATGTGKTITLQGLAESFAATGVSVFIADIKGDLSGISQLGQAKDVLIKRAADIGYSYQPAAYPVTFWDVYGDQGLPMRVTISEMGPLLLSRIMELNDTQEGVLNIAFAIADAEGLLLLDLDDLRALLTHISDHARDYTVRYGNISTASIGAIQRALLVLEQQGAKEFFGEPAFDISDLIRNDAGGIGMVNILSAAKLVQSPRLYSMFMLWLLGELFENLPEAGDLPKPKLVFFFDEAHLLFNDAPKALVEKIEQLARLIRSKGVGVYFITQNPADIPENVLGQLSNRIQHGLRAFTPKDQKGVRAAAETFRANPSFKTEEAITLLAVGEALVSTLDEKGTPTVVDRVLIKPPLSLVGPASVAHIQALISGSPLASRYRETVNRESAYERLTTRINQQNSNAAPAQTEPTKRTSGRQPESIATTITKSVVRAAGSQLGRQIARGVLSSLLKSR